MSKERAVARQKERERNNYIAGGVIMFAVTGAVLFGLYKIYVSTNQWMQCQAREKRPWEKQEPEPPSTTKYYEYPD